MTNLLSKCDWNHLHYRPFIINNIKTKSVKLVFHKCLLHRPADWCLISQRGTPRFSISYFIWLYWLRFFFYFFFFYSSSSWQYKEWSGGTLSWLEAVFVTVVSIVTNDKPCRSFRGIIQKTKFERVRTACLQVCMNVTCNAWLPELFGSVKRANFNANN